MTLPENSPKSLVSSIDKVKIFADYFQIYLRDQNTDLEAEEMWQLFNPMDKIVAKPGFVSIGTFFGFVVT